MPTYSEKLQDPRWQRLRLEVMKRDDFACVICKDKRSQLAVHHLEYVGRNPWNTPESKLVTLCKNHHSKVELIIDEVRRSANNVVAMQLFWFITVAVHKKFYMQELLALIQLWWKRREDDL